MSVWDPWMALPVDTVARTVSPMVYATAERLDTKPKPLPRLESSAQIIERHAMTEPTPTVETVHRLQWEPPGDGAGFITHSHADDWDGPDVTECGFFEYVNSDWQALPQVVRKEQQRVLIDFVRVETGNENGQTYYWNGTFRTEDV